MQRSPLITTIVLSLKLLIGQNQSTIATNANYTTGVNVIAIAQQQLVTCGTKQYFGYINTSGGGTIEFAYRSLPISLPSTWTIVNPGLPATGNDDHQTVSLGCDKNHYLHVSYGMHNSNPLVYRRSTNPNDVSAWSAILPMLANSCGDSATYPFYISSPASELMFTCRGGGDGDGNQYFYCYNAGTTIWSGCPGTGSGGLLIAYLSESPTQSPYLNGPPLYDRNGILWFQWEASDVGVIHDQYLMGWTGSAFKTFSGSAQTVPVTVANSPLVVTIPESAFLTVQNIFGIDASGVFYIPYMRKASGQYQVFVATSYTGSFVEHQLTSASVVPVLNDLQVTAVPGGGATYVVWPDVFNNSTGALTAKSTDGFATNTQFYFFRQYNPNWTLKPDNAQLANGILSFTFMNASDSVYGAVYPFFDLGHVYSEDYRFPLVGQSYLAPQSSIRGIGDIRSTAFGGIR